MAEFIMSKLGILLGTVVAGVVLFFSGNDFSTEESVKMKPARHEWDERSVKSFAESINKLLPQLREEKSLLYSSGNYVFQVSRYKYQGKPVLYVEKGGSGGDIQKFEKRYYLKDNRLAFYSEATQSAHQTRPYISTNAYFRNNTLFHAEQKSALTDSGLKAVRFQRTDLIEKDQFSDLAMLEEAVEQRGRFNLVFEGIAEYPKAKYIILGREGLHSLRAPIRVEHEDEFIHELSSDPDRFRGEKLEIDWKLKDSGEAIYESGKLSKN